MLPVHIKTDQTDGNDNNNYHKQQR